MTPQITTQESRVKQRTINNQLHIESSGEPDIPIDIVKTLKPFISKGYRVLTLNYEGLPKNTLKVKFKA